MIFVSLGSTCTVRYNIEKFTKSNETPYFFFDWILSTIKTTNYLLSHDKFLFRAEDVHVVGKWDDGKGKMTKRICLDTLPNFESLHDIPLEDDSEEGVHNFLQRYERRWTRLTSLIESEIETCFIHFGMPTKIDIEIFLDLVQRRNSHTHHKLCVCYYDNSNSYHDKSNKCIYFNFADYPVVNHTEEWKKNGYAWETLFDLLRKFE